MLLNDVRISEAYWSEDIDIDPYDAKYLQPASYDVHLGARLLIPSPDTVSRGIDPGNLPEDAHSKLWKEITLYPRAHPNEWYIPPGGVALGHTQEIVTLSHDSALAADIAGCSSLGRWFLAVHMTAGFIDPNWSGRLTLELYNASPWWIRLWEGMRIAQLRFYWMGQPSERSYLERGHYGHADTVQPSNYHG